jgi:hypothetical protein
MFTVRIIGQALMNSACKMSPPKDKLVNSIKSTDPEERDTWQPGSRSVVKMGLWPILLGPDE